MGGLGGEGGRDTLAAGRNDDDVAILQLVAECVFETIGIDVRGIGRDLQVSDQTLAEECFGCEAGQVGSPADIAARGEDVSANIRVHFDSVGERPRLAGALEFERGKGASGAMAENLGAINDAA